MIAETAPAVQPFPKNLETIKQAWESALASTDNFYDALLMAAESQPAYAIGGRLCDESGQPIPEGNPAGDPVPDDNELTNCITENDIDEPLTFTEIVKRIHASCGNWPARVGSSLFVHDSLHGISFLQDAPALFGWLSGSTNRVVTWRVKAGCIGKYEFFRELQRQATEYAAIERLPHEPPIPGHYYACDDLPEPDDDKLTTFLDFFSPATPIDRDLILAALMTMFWGNASGDRPCFIVTSDDGRGVGKSTLVEVLCQVAGGWTSFDSHHDMARMKTRLLTAPSMSTRAALLDNVKSFNFSWPELEALITSPTINGHRMYQGDASRPNNLCWFITFNGASLSKDMAQRSVIIKLRRTECTQTWESDVKQYIADHAPSIVAAVVARLREPAEPLRRYTRWSGWESAVLSRLPEPADAQRVIAERQGEADVDEDKSELIFDGFAERLADLNYNIETDRVHIPASVAHEWLNEILGEKESVTKTTRYLKQLVTENRTSMIQIDPSRTTGRGFLWAGPNEPARTDIKARIDMKKQRQSGRMF